MQRTTEAAPGPERIASRQARPGHGRMILLLIAGIPVTVILAASWMWYFVANGRLNVVGVLGTSNRGALVQPPRQAMDAGWLNARSEPLDVAAFGAPYWTIVVPQAAALCAAGCEQRLFTTRQIHQALGKERGRVRRMLVTSADGDLELGFSALSDGRPLPANFAAYLHSEQRGLSVWRTSLSAFAGLFPELGAAPRSWYLMDPNGWVMMRYDSTVDYKDVIADLKFLLKNSNG